MQGKLHEYHLTRELAKKYSHTTYLASLMDPQRGHDEPESQVILTVFTSSLFPLPHERQKLLHKAQRIQELEHPHLAPILDMGLEDEQPFVVREYLPHDSLRNRLKALSPDRLALRDALIIISQIGQALAYAHKHYLLHGNLKPENIFLDANGQALLTDFSLVERKDAILRDQTSEEYAFCYLAPEQFAGTCDARSDQYALGCLAYELIAGHVPFAAQTLASIMGHQNNILPSPLSESIADLSPSLDAAILKTLAKDPAERFFDFSLFLEVVQSALLLSPALPLSFSATSRKQRITSRRTRRRPKVRTFSPSSFRSTTFSSPTLKIPEAGTIQPSEEYIPSALAADPRDTRSSLSQTTMNGGTSKSSIDTGRKSLVSEVSFSKAPTRDQISSQQDADDMWLTNPFEQQESHDQLLTGFASLGQELYAFDRDKKDQLIISLPKELGRDIPLRRQTQYKKSKVLGLVLLCLVIVASGTYAALFLSSTNKPENLVRPTQVVKEVLIPVQNGTSPTQPVTLMATAQPTPRITTIPVVVPTPTPTLRPVVRQILAIDDSVEGTDLNQFNYIGSGWNHCNDGCNGCNCYDGTWSGDDVAGDNMTVSFTGVQIKFYVVVGPSGGLGAISLDGGSETMIDFYSTEYTGDLLKWTSPMMPAGTHTFKLRVTGTKDPDSQDYNMGVDRVDILS